MGSFGTTKQPAASDAENRRLAYKELCKSYHAIDDFRLKLLGFLPLASGTGIFLLLQNKLGTYLLPVGIFGALVTVGLFCFELHGISKCDRLISAGKEMEKDFEVEGQFSPEVRPGIIGIELASTLVYSAVLGAWIAVALAHLGPQAALWTAVALASITFGLSLQIACRTPWWVRVIGRLAWFWHMISLPQSPLPSAGPAPPADTNNAG